MLEHTLRNDHSDRFEVTLKFTLVAPPREDVNADELQAIDAVATASQAVVPLGATPTTVGVLSLAVDASQKVVAEIQTFDSTWGVLLKRMELFNKIVTDIAQVFRAQCLDLFMV